MKTCDTLSEAIRALQQRGYDQDFNLTNAHLHCTRSCRDSTSRKFKL
ncbi:MAG TPA: hypothetical protein VK364_11695 [Hymenobacter sp.]|nr:hypothetical protein [Hymenobacter sp.]